MRATAATVLALGLVLTGCGGAGHPDAGGAAVPSPGGLPAESANAAQAGGPAEDSPLATAPPEGTHTITLSGAAAGNGFDRQGTLEIRPTITRNGTTNGVNVLDVCIRSGFPAGQPEAGALWFGSNAGCFRDGGELDLAEVGVEGATITVVPDVRSAESYGSNFSTTGGASACVYTPFSGRATIRFHANGRISGSIDVQGAAGDFCGNGKYRADISG
jgi:hypothetical protein